MIEKKKKFCGRRFLVLLQVEVITWHVKSDAKVETRRGTYAHREEKSYLRVFGGIYS